MSQTERIEDLTREGVLALNKIWDTEGWTNSAIIQEMDKHGEGISNSTVIRLRKEGAENQKFNYGLTIKPMLRVFSRISEEPISIKDVTSPEQLQIATLNNTLLMREADIKVLTTKLEAEEKRNVELEKRIDEIKSDSDRKVQNLLGQINREVNRNQNADKHMDERADFLRQKDKEISDWKSVAGKYETEVKTKEARLKRQERFNVILGILLVVVTGLLIFALGSDAYF